MKRLMHRMAWIDDYNPPEAYDDTADALCRDAIDFAGREVPKTARLRDLRLSAPRVIRPGWMPCAWSGYKSAKRPSSTFTNQPTFFREAQAEADRLCAGNAAAPGSEVPAKKPGDKAPASRESRPAKKTTRRPQKYKAIDKALREFGASQPNGHEEVFRFLDGRKVAVPDRGLFKSAGGWIKGYEHNAPSARSWLSQAWGRLQLPAFRRGPKK